MSVGNWYYIVYERTENDPRENTLVREVSEVIFIQEGGSVAKHIKGYVKENTDIPEDAEFIGSTWVEVKELSLLLPDGQKMSGFKPRSIAHMFCVVPKT